jgi:glycosyltransferase involved in cell wall biosynthesis
MISNQPLVSILIPVYNSEDYIVETLESCLSQSYSNIEIIIVDDGSKDNSLVICEKYEKKHEFIEVFSQENSGAPKARNFAFEKSKGKYIQYLDADDLLTKDKIKCQVELLISEDYKTISYTNFIEFSKENKAAIENVTPKVSNYTNSIDFFNHLLKTGWLQTSCWLVSRELIHTVGKWREDLSRNQDGDFFGRVILHSKNGVYSKNGGVFYRRENLNSITAQKKGLKYYESYLKSFYYSADIIVARGTNSQKFQIAKAMNGLCERLFLLDSKEVYLGYEKIKKLGFLSNDALENSFLRYLKPIFGYKNSLRLKSFISRCL